VDHTVSNGENGAASSRRLARLALDLHDGPLQDLAALASDLKLLRGQTATAPPEIVRGRIDDALAMLASVESDVRELARSLESKRVAEGPFVELVMTEAGEAEAEGIRSDVSILGDARLCTASQRIALYRVVQESLANVRRHSGASQVSVRVLLGAETLVAEIVDDGRGFDVEGSGDTSMGLAGMHERVDLLGGALSVTSRAGGPTTVRATIPRWMPAQASDQAAAMPRASA
jgi:signal transduction histidine kinase